MTKGSSVYEVKTLQFISFAKASKDMEYKLSHKKRPLEKTSLVVVESSISIGPNF